MMKYCEKNQYKLLIVTLHPPTEKALEGAKKLKFLSLFMQQI